MYWTERFMLSDTCVKQQNKIGKIFTNSNFHFFKIEPKLSKSNLWDLKNLRKIILRAKSYIELKKFENFQKYRKKPYF